MTLTLLTWLTVAGYAGWLFYGLVMLVVSGFLWPSDNDNEDNTL